MAIRKRSLRNARNLRSKRSRRYGGAGSKGSNSSGKKTTKVRGNKRPVRAFSQVSSPGLVGSRAQPAKAIAVGHHDYVNVIRKEYRALADLVQKHIDDSEHLKTEFYKLKSKSVFLK